MTQKILVLFVFVILVGYGCQSDKCPDVYLSEYDLIQDFHLTYNDSPATEKDVSEDFDIYLDFSVGMKVAFKDNFSYSFYELFVNSLKLSAVNFYEVNNSEIKKIESAQKNDLYKIVKEAKRYTGKNAPLDEAVNQIVENNKEAIFITDGELWNDGERDDPWAREAFAEWLKAGNTLDFYITDHSDAGNEKHLFYILFIPKSKIKSKSGVYSDFRFYLENSAKAKTMSYTHLSFSNSNFGLTPEYESETSGGVNEFAELDPEKYINNKAGNFEYHEYYLTWKGIVEYIANAYDDNGKKLSGGDPLISKLFLSASISDFYKIEELDLKVYDIKKEFDKFRQIKEAKSNPPTFELDEQGERILDEQNLPIINCLGQSECYDMENGKLLIDTTFKKSKSIEIKELYHIDNLAFSNNLKEQGKGEIVIKIHENFNGRLLSEEDDNLHRIDVVLKKVTSLTTNPVLEKFIWKGKHVEKNRSLYNSILGALNEANPQGKVIYSYYIKTFPTDY